MAADLEALPFIDEHRIAVRAAPDVVWSAVVRAVRGVTNRGVALLLGADPAGTRGRLPERGASVPGFRVAAATPGSRLELSGRHRFSRYTLVFSLTAAADGRTVLAARSHAQFPGLPGRAYRALVI